MQLILDGEIDLVINTPHGSTGGGSARLDGYEIRTAAIMANIPCITTVQGLGAAVQGIEAIERGEIGVRSLQDWALRRRSTAPVTHVRTACCSTTSSPGPTPSAPTTRRSGRSAPPDARAVTPSGADPSLGAPSRRRSSPVTRWG